MVLKLCSLLCYYVSLPALFPAAPQNKIQIQISSTAAVLAIFFRRKVQKYSIFEAKWHSFYRGEANFPNPHKIGEFLQKGAFCVSFRLRLWGRFAKLSSLRCILLHNASQWARMLNYILALYAALYIGKSFLHQLWKSQNYCQLLLALTFEHGIDLTSVDWEFSQCHFQLKTVYGPSEMLNLNGRLRERIRSTFSVSVEASPQLSDMMKQMQPFQGWGSLLRLKPGGFWLWQVLDFSQSLPTSRSPTSAPGSGKTCL